RWLFGLSAMGNDVCWLEVRDSSGNSDEDQERIRTFFRRFKGYGFGGRCALLLHDRDVNKPMLEQARAYGMSSQQIREIAKSADLMWDFACGLREPLLSLFKHRVLLDLDPGHLQVSALTLNMGIHDHDTFLSVGTKLHDADCKVPTLGVKWHRFFPFVYLPMWDVAPDADKNAPFTSV